MFTELVNIIGNVPGKSQGDKMGDADRRGGARPGAGAPKGNRNALKHGFSTGRLPPGAGYITTLTNRLKATLTAAVLDQRRGSETVGPVDLTIAESARITTAVRWERVSLLAAYYLRHHHADLSPTERLQHVREIAAASERRDKSIAALDLETTPTDAWQVVDARPATPDPPG